MKAAVIHEVNGSPVWGDFERPVAQEGQVGIIVSAAAIGPSERLKASTLGESFFGPFKAPVIIGGEGIGYLESGERVYFGHAVAPYGAVAEYTIVPEAEVWPIPASLSDEQVLPLAISGSGALIALEEAKIQPGDKVLILGGTGPLGQIAMQIASVMGAAEVVVAARNLAPLQAAVERGFADNYVQLGLGDDAGALKAAAGDGFNVVLDCVYGETVVAAIKATAPGARIMSIANPGGRTAPIELGHLIYRSHIGVATGMRPAAERRAAFERLLAMTLAEKIAPINTVSYHFSEAASAWQGLASGSYGKVILHPAAQ